MLECEQTVVLYSTVFFTSIEESYMSKVSSRDYLSELERDDCQGESLGDVPGSESLDSEAESEAERAARSAPSPHRRQDGHVLGSAASRLKPLTPAQLKFAQGVIAGQTLRQAYKDAYPGDNTSDQAISASAWRLSKRPKVAQMLEEAWGQTVEVLADDLAATRRWVMRQLVAHSREDKQEGSRLKALELLGKASGVFTQATVSAPEAVTADQLKRELSGHLKLLDNVKPIKTGTDKV
jgi:hypothetical protein